MTRSKKSDSPELIDGQVALVQFAQCFRMKRRESTLRFTRAGLTSLRKIAPLEWQALYGIGNETGAAG